MPNDELMKTLPKDVQKTIKSAEKLGKRIAAKRKREEQKLLRETADKFLEALRERVDFYVLLGDVDALGRLVAQVDYISGWEVLHALREKGLDKEITALCDKAGRVSKI